MFMRDRQIHAAPQYRNATLETQRRRSNVAKFSRMREAGAADRVIEPHFKRDYHAHVVRLFHFRSELCGRGRDGDSQLRRRPAKGAEGNCGRG
jgi:hypothetical protein